MHTRTGPHAAAIASAYCGGISLPSFKIARLITFQVTWTSRIPMTSCIHREVIHAQGHIGSNQNRAFTAANVVHEARAAPW